MGYVPQRKTYRLIFEGEEFQGLTVVAKSAGLGQYMDIAGLANLDPAGTFTPAEIDQSLKLFEAFAAVLVEWNVEEPEGVPVPATLHGLRSLDFPFVLRIILAWMDAVARVAPPLEQPSAGGELSLEASLPMEVLSPSR
jgi:hypothetical protein